MVFMKLHSTVQGVQCLHNVFYITLSLLSKQAKLGAVSTGACLQDRVSQPRISDRRSLRDGRMAPWPCVRAGQPTQSRTVSLGQSELAKLRTGR